jgi:hypothetical protein
MTKIIFVFKQLTIFGIPYPARACQPFFVLASLLIFAFEGKTWTGHGDGGAIRESTGREFSFHRRNQRVSAKRGGRPAASA